MYRDDRAQYNQRAKDTVAVSKRDIPDGFVMPTTLDTAPPTKMVDDDAFWAESDAEDDFGASDSSGEDFEMDEDEDEDDGEEQGLEEDGEEGDAKAES
jgi:ubiquitin-conjugating enzyme E2 R